MFAFRTRITTTACHLLRRSSRDTCIRLLSVPVELSEPEYAFEMASSSIRFGRGVTKVDDYIQFEHVLLIIY